MPLPLLCESCGYSIGTLPAHAPCPECGRPATQSLPEYRTGSPWQVRPTLWSWVRTNWRVLRHPDDLYERVMIVPGKGRGLLLLNVVVAAFFLVDPWTGVLVGDPARAARNTDRLSETITYAWVLGIQVGAAALILLVLTWVEGLGLRFFGARRGWRVTRDVASQVCAHASVGWIFAALFPLVALALSTALVRNFPEWGGRFMNQRIDLSAFTPWAKRVSVGELVTLLGLVGGFLGGLMVFEMLVYVGVRRCRYANAPSEDPRAG